MCLQILINEDCVKRHMHIYMKQYRKKEKGDLSDTDEERKKDEDKMKARNANFYNERTTRNLEQARLWDHWHSHSKIFIFYMGYTKKLKPNF